jgi:hypothetical protein
MKWLFDFYGDQGMGVILHVKQGLYINFSIFKTTSCLATFYNLVVMFAIDITNVDIQFGANDAFQA